MLQVQLEDLVKALAGGNNAPEFTNALALAKERSIDSRNDFITLFAEAWEETSNGMPPGKISFLSGTRQRECPSWVCYTYSPLYIASQWCILMPKVYGQLQG